MLEQILGSKTRVQIITLFVRNPDKLFFVREIARTTGQYINAIRRELGNLERFGFLISKTQDKKRFYSINKNFFLLDELKHLFVKSNVFLENDLTNELKKIGDIKMLVLTGAFTDADTQTDLLVVGDNVLKNEITQILENFSLTQGHEIRYTLFTVKDFQYREDISDQFLHTLFSQKHIVLVDKIDRK